MKISGKLIVSTLFLGFLFLAFLGISLYILLQRQTKQPQLPSTRENFYQKAQTSENKRVLVELRLPAAFRPEGELSTSAAEIQRSMIHKVRNDLLRNLSGYDVVVLSDSDRWVIPYLALSVDEAAFSYLSTSPQVSSISDDMADDPPLTPAVDIPTSR